MGPRHAHDVVRLGRELEPAPHGGRRPAPSGPASTIGESTVRHPEPARGRRNRLDRQFQAGLVPAPDRPAAPDPQSGVERGSTPAKGVAYGRSTSGAQLPRLSRGRRLGWGLLRWPGADGASPPAGPADAGVQVEVRATAGGSDLRRPGGRQGGGRAASRGGRFPGTAALSPSAPRGTAARAAGRGRPPPSSRPRSRATWSRTRRLARAGAAEGQVARTSGPGPRLPRVDVPAVGAPRRAPGAELRAAPRPRPLRRPAAPA